MQGLGLTVEEFSRRGEDEPGPGIAGKKTGAGRNWRGVRGVRLKENPRPVYRSTPNSQARPRSAAPKPDPVRLPDAAVGGGAHTNLAGIVFKRATPGLAALEMQES
jgi:hypothetical protein